jgi:endonuclease/exonuclease/phosphatase family metal-dependent hydrolase
MASQPVTVMTWNIHGGVGLDGIHDLARIADVIAHVNPDILALQEVANRRAEATLLSLIRARRPYGDAVPAVAVSTEDGDSGQLVLSRWPVRDVIVHDISVARYEPRRLVSLIAATPAGDLHVLATHLGLRFSERRAQAAVLREVARPIAAPIIALGDFNDWLRWRSVSAFMDEIFPRRTRHPTFPARLPILSLDRIYCAKSITMLSAGVPVRTLASDHLPLAAELQLPGAA